MKTTRFSSGVRLIAVRALLSIPVLTVFALFASPDALAQGPKGKSFGFGLQLGEPTAVNFRFWQGRLNSWEAAFGVSVIGSPHIHAMYLWHFTDAFNSDIVFLYAGVGGAIGFGDDDGIFFSRRRNAWYYDDDGNVAFAARGSFGLNIIPRNTPIDIFLELDPIFGIIPDFGFGIQGSLGIRFYP